MSKRFRIVLSVAAALLIIAGMFTACVPRKDVAKDTSESNAFYAGSENTVGFEGYTKESNAPYAGSENTNGFESYTKDELSLQEASGESVLKADVSDLASGAAGDETDPAESASDDSDPASGAAGDETSKRQLVERSLYDYENILGYAGYYVDKIEAIDGWTQRTYYAKTKDGDVPVAESFGFVEADAQIDIDGDGKKELVCNTMCEADGHTEVYVYKKVGNEIQVAYADWMSLEFDDLEYWGCNSVQTYYDHLSGKIVILYCKKDADEWGYRLVDSDVLRYEKYEPGDEPGAYLPSIYIDDAFEKYAPLELPQEK